MTSLDFLNNNSFSVWASKHLSIDETNDGQPLVQVPDTNGNWYQVECLETKTNIIPVSCSCGKHDCKHQQVVDAFYAKLYKRPQAEKVAKKIESFKQAWGKPNRQKGDWTTAPQNPRAFSVMR